MNEQTTIRTFPAICLPFDVLHQILILRTLTPFQNLADTHSGKRMVFFGDGINLERLVPKILVFDLVIFVRLSGPFLEIDLLCD